jgi:hypothetical protein
MSLLIPRVTSRDDQSVEKEDIVTPHVSCALQFLPSSIQNEKDCTGWPR